MIALPLSQIITTIAGTTATPELLTLASQITIDQVSTNSQITPSVHGERSLFIALSSAKYPTEVLIAKAYANHYRYMVVDHIPTGLDPKIQAGLIVVTHPLEALQQLAKTVRDIVDPTVIAITGSSGKTTVKQYLLAMLTGAFGSQQVQATQGNFNNEIGVPLTLLQLTEQTKYLIVEHGANHPGEIDRTTSLSQPDIACINNVQPAHTAGFGGVNGVLHAKMEIFNHLAPTGVRVVNLTSLTDAQMFVCDANQRVITIGNQDSMHHQAWSQYVINESASHPSATGYELKFMVNAAFTKSDDDTVTNSKLDNPHTQNYHVSLPLKGQHNLYNFVTATAMAQCLGLSVAQCLTYLQQHLIKAPRRQEEKPLFATGVLIDDTYNANPGSVMALIHTLPEYPQSHKCFIFGQLAEVNDQDLATFYTKLYLQYQTAQHTIVSPNTPWQQQPLNTNTLITTARFVTDVSAFADNPAYRILPLQTNETLYVVIDSQFNLDKLTQLVQQYFSQYAAQNLTDATDLLVALKGSNSNKLDHLVAELPNYLTKILLN